MRPWPLAAILSAAPLLAQPPPDVELELVPDEITVGDRVAATLTVVWMGEPLADTPRFPAWQESWGEAAVLEVGELDAFVDQSGRTVARQQLTLTAFRPKEIKLPSLTVALPLGDETLEVRTPETTLTVLSVLPEDPEEEIEPRPPAGLEALPIGATFPATAAMLAALCLGASILLVRRRAAAGASALPPLLDPYPELVGRLEALDPRLGPEPAHTELSSALRRYLGRALDFQALESTTTEIRRRLGQTPIPTAAARATSELLRDCDGVKFARLEADPGTIRSRVRAARDLAFEIDRRLHPPDPEEDAA